MENKKNYKKVEFEHKAIKLSAGNKQGQVEKIIKEFAKIAKSNKPLF